MLPVLRLFPLAIALALSVFPGPQTALGQSRGGPIRPAHEGPHDRPGKGGSVETDPVALGALASLQGLAPCVAGRAVELFPCEGVDLASFVSLDDLHAGAASGSNLWGFADSDDGREYAVIGLNAGTAVVEVTDPTRPRVVGSVSGPPSAWREVKVYQRWNPSRLRHDAWAYVVSEAPTAGCRSSTSRSCPLRSPSSTRSAASIRRTRSSSRTSIRPPGHRTSATARRSSTSRGRTRAFSRSTSAIRVRLRSWDATSTLTSTTSGRASFAGRARRAARSATIPARSWSIGAAMRSGSSISRSSPRRGSCRRCATRSSGTRTPDGSRGTATTSSASTSWTRSRAPATRASASSTFATRPMVAGVWTSTTPAIEHNGYVVGDRLYVSHYERGVTVLDVSTPTAPREIGFFDTFPASDTARFHGAWGVYPFLPSGTLLVSNIDGAGGLFVLRQSSAGLSPPDGPRGPVLPVAPRQRTARPVPGSR